MFIGHGRICAAPLRGTLHRDLFHEPALGRGQLFGRLEIELDRLTKMEFLGRPIEKFDAKDVVIVV
jgi:hypothetical protein